MRRRPDGRWEWRGRIRGESRSLYADRRGDLAALVQQGRQEPAISPESITFDLAWAHWIASRRLRRSSTLAYEGKVERYIRPRIGHVRIADVTRTDIAAILEGVPGLSAREKVRQLLTSVAKYVVANQLGQDFMRGAPSVPRSPRRVEFFEQLEVTAILEQAHRHSAQALVVVSVLFGTGIRRGELLALRWGDVRGDTLSVSFTADEQGRLQPPKTRSSVRAMRLPRQVLDALAQWKLESTSTQPADRILGISKVTLRALFGTLCRMAGVRELTLHCTRHTHATQLLSMGVPIATVAARLGHASPTITLSTYAHAISADDQSAASAADRLLRG